MSEDKPSDKKELDELLDSALEDFGKSEPKNNPNEAATGATAAAKNKEPAGEDATAAAAPPTSDTDAFCIEAAQKVAERLNQIFEKEYGVPSNTAPPEENPLLYNFKMMAEAAAMTLQGENPSTDEEVAKFSDSIGQALKGLQEGSDNLSELTSSLNLGPEELDRLGLSEERMAGMDSEGNSFLPFMEGMMQSLLSAEILLPSIKDLLEKYPKYFEEHGSKLSAEDRERYEKQLELYKVIEKQLELEKPDDSAAAKREKFKVVLEHMRKLQDYGTPPDEILKENFPDAPFSEFDMYKDATSQAPSTCPTM